MAGVALGPGLAGLIRAHAGLESLSTLTAAAITVAALGFAIAARGAPAATSMPLSQS
jgi:hypothetical protein